MMFLILRLLLAPLAVLASTVAQRRFGHAISGLIVGLPLASLPLLWLVAVQHGDAFAGTMTAALLVGGIAEAAVLWLYAHFTTRLAPLAALVVAVVSFALVAIVVHVLGLSALIAGVVTALGFAVALWWWPSSAPDSVAGPGRSRITVQVVLAAIFTFVLVTLAGRLGPVWSGLLDALPAMSMMMAFFTHQDNGAAASSGFLRGVTRGSFSYLAAMLVLAELLHTGDLLLAFASALVAALAVQGLIQTYDSLSTPRRPAAAPVEVSASPSLASTGEDRDPVAVEFVEEQVPSGHRHHERQHGAHHLGTVAVGPVEVRRAQPDPFDPTLGADQEVRSLPRVGHCHQSGVRRTVRETEGTTDVLTVHDDFAQHRRDRSGRVVGRRGSRPQAPDQFARARRGDAGGVVCGEPVEIETVRRQLP
jgi:hypothetical protein